MVSWSLDSKGRVVLGAGTDWDDLKVRAEVRADVRVLADQLKRPVGIMDPNDPVKGRICELVEPTRVPYTKPVKVAVEIPPQEVDHDEPGITRGRVLT